MDAERVGFLRWCESRREHLRHLCLRHSADRDEERAYFTLCDRHCHFHRHVSRGGHGAPRLAARCLRVHRDGHYHWLLGRLRGAFGSPLRPRPGPPPLR